ncbi:MAG TPA: transposase [Tepidisphaeraceae bacterium]|nr:transposase [Tepidisphaeraceae bacterium]
MPRHPRHAPGGIIYHVLNRAAGRRELFADAADYAAFIRVIAGTLESAPMRICSFCLMPNHWHLLLWPERDGDLARFMQKLTITHVRRWVEHRHRVGHGSVYQGRYKSFPTENDAHFTTVARYIERNAVRAGIARRAEQWRWSSLGQKATLETPLIPLAAWPVRRRKDWTDWVNQPQTAAEEAALRHCLSHNRPFGSEQWTVKMESVLNLGPFRKSGRPKKEVKT